MLVPGTRLGSYEIMAAIGAGSMGEVSGNTTMSFGKNL